MLVDVEEFGVVVMFALRTLENTSFCNIARVTEIVVVEEYGVVLSTLRI